MGAPANGLPPLFFTDVLGEGVDGRPTTFVGIVIVWFAAGIVFGIGGGQLCGGSVSVLRWWFRETVAGDRRPLFALVSMRVKRAVFAWCGSALAMWCGLCVFSRAMQGSALDAGCCGSSSLVIVIRFPPERAWPGAPPAPSTLAPSRAQPSFVHNFVCWLAWRSGPPFAARSPPFIFPKSAFYDPST